MAVLNIDTSNEGNFEQKNFDPIPKGIYRFCLDNKLKVSKANSGNNMIKVELKCVDEAEDGKFLGKTVYDNLVLTSKCEWKLTQFALSAEVYTEAELKAAGGIDTELFIPGDTEFTVSIDVENYKDKEGNAKMRNVVKSYMWEKEGE